MKLLFQISFLFLTCFTNHTIAGQKNYFDPFDVVVIYSVDAYHRDYISFEANSVNVLPAFYFPAVQSSLNNKNLASTLKVTGGIVMVGVSVASMGTAATSLAALLDFTEALASTYILISTEGSFLTEISAEYGNNSWQYQTASKVNTFFEVYLLCRFGYAALGPLRSLALEIKNISASDVSFFQSNYPKFYERLLSVRNKAGEVLSGGSGVGKYWRTAVEMRDDVMNWAKAYQSKLPTPTQLDKFSKATAASYRKADGTIETVFGRNGGVLNKQSSYPTISAEKNLSLHKDLADRLPTSTQWPNTANCAECDAVNQALHNGAKWEDIQIHTIDIRPNGTMNDVIQCAECENIFKNMYVTSQ